MAESDDQKSPDEIRVVGDEEEVIRLDSPQKRRVEKSGKATVETLESAMGGGAEDREEASEAAGDEKVKWGDEFSKKEEAGAVPMGWFYLLGIGLVGVLVWMGFQIAFKDPGEGEEINDGGAAADTVVEPVADLKARMEAEKHFRKMEEVVAEFLAAGTVEERVKFVRHPERVLPLMKEFYASRPLRTFQFEKIGSYTTRALSARPFIVLVVVTKEKNGVPILVEDGGDGLLVDWESFVCYQPMSPEEYVEKRPAEPMSFRVYATLDNFYAYEFSKEEEYRCFRLQFRNSETEVFGYVKRGSAVERKFREVYADARFKMSKPLILKLRFLEGSKAKRGVLIEDLESSLWAYAENPDEKSE